MQVLQDTLASEKQEENHIATEEGQKTYTQHIGFDIINYHYNGVFCENFCLKVAISVMAIIFVDNVHR